MNKVFHMKYVAMLLALGMFAACSGKAEIQKAKDDTAAALKAVAAAQATADSATRKAEQAAKVAGQARQEAMAVAARSAESVTAKPVAAPMEPPVIPAQPVVAPEEPAVVAVEPAVVPAEPAVTLAEPDVTPAEPVVTGDAVAGKAKARRCLACHSFDEGGRHKMGPNLFGISGQAAGTAAGYRFSAGLKNAGFIWDAKKLADWVCDSKAAIKVLTGNADARTTMGNQRICGSDAANVAAYLESLK